MPTHKRGPGRPKRKMSAADRLRRLDVDPLVYLAHIIDGTEEPNPSKIEAAKALMPHVYAKLRSVEVDVAHQHNIVVKIGAHATDVMTHVIEHTPMHDVTHNDDALITRVSDDDA